MNECTHTIIIIYIIIYIYIYRGLYKKYYTYSCRLFFNKSEPAENL